MAIDSNLYNKLTLASDNLNSATGLPVNVIAGGGSSSNISSLKQADDLVTDITYLDITSNKKRRINTITYSSVSLALTMTETFTYGTQDSKNYYITKITVA